MSTESKHVLITGASGLIGQQLTQALQDRGYSVSRLTRKKNSSDPQSFHWDISKDYVDPEAFKKPSVIVHLAGAGIADKRWTASRKKEILESRVNSARLLFDSLRNVQGNIKAIVSASAVGYYGNDPDKYFSEDDQPGTDFLADVTRQWENEIVKFPTLGIREVRIRTGVVLSRSGGALAKMAMPIKWGVGSPLGSGKQMMSWIHMDDLIAIFIQAIERTDMTGPYNAVSPNPVSNQEMTRAVAKMVKRPLWLPPVPGAVLKLILGEMAEMVLKGSWVSSKKILSTGFAFKFETLESALAEIYSNQ